MPTPRFKERNVEWAALHDNLTQLLAEHPHLTADHEALAGLLTKARDLESRKGFANSELQEINRQRRDLGVQGRELRNRVAGALRHILGPESKRLLRYGLQPQQEPSRRRPLTPAERAAQLAEQAAEAAARVEAEAAVRAALAAKARLTRSKPEPAPKP